MLERIKSHQFKVIKALDWEKEDKDFVPLRGTWHANSENDFELDKEVESFLSSQKKVLLLLGHSGGGKSFYTKQLVLSCWKNCTEGSSASIPLWISLPSLKDPIHQAIHDTFEAMGFVSDEIETLRQSQTFLFILDGYDEIHNLKNLYVGNQLSHWQAKVIITCRQEYLYSVENYASFFMPFKNERPLRAAYSEIIIRPFNPAQIEHYGKQFIQNHEIKKGWDSYAKAMEEIPGLKQLITKPFMLKLAMEALPSLIESYQATSVLTRQQLTQARLYDVFVGQWFIRQEEKLKLGQHIGQNEDIKTEFWNYAKSLAKAMYEAGKSEVFYAGEESTLFRSGAKEVNPWKKYFNPQEPRLKLLRTACLVQEVSLHHYAFIHPSLIEYFLTRDLFDSVLIPEKKDIPEAVEKPVKVGPQIPETSSTSSNLNQHFLVKDVNIIQFLADRVWEEPAYKDFLFEQVYASKNDPRMSTAASNAITILNHARVSFSGMNLSGIQIPHADLTSALLDCTNFFGAKLNGVNFRSAWMREVSLEKSDVENVQFGENPHLRLPGEIISSYPYAGEEWLSLVREKEGLHLYQNNKKEILKSLAVLKLPYAYGHSDEIRNDNIKSCVSIALQGHVLALSYEGNIELREISTNQIKRNLVPLKKENPPQLSVNLMSLEPCSVDMFSSELDLLDMFSPHLFLLVKHPDENWKLSVKNTFGEMICDIEVSEIDHLQEALDNLPRNKLPEDLTADEKIDVVKAINNSEYCFMPLVSTMESFESDSYFLVKSKYNRAWKLFCTDEDRKPGSNILPEISELEKFLQTLPSDKLPEQLSVAEKQRIETIITAYKNIGVVSCIALSLDGKKLAVGCGEEIILWVTESGQLLPRLKSENEKTSFDRIAFNAKGHLLAAQSNKDEMYLWDMEQFKLLGRIDLKDVQEDEHGAIGTALPDPEIVFSSDDQYLVVGHEDIRVFTIPDLNLLHIFKKSGGDSCTCLSLSHDQRYLAAGFGKSIMIGEIETGHWVDKLEGHDKTVRSLAFSYHGKELISAGEDGAVRYWDAENWEVRRLNKKEEMTVECIAVSDDGKLLAMAHGNMVSLWSIAPWQKLCSFEGDKWAVDGLAFSADSQYLALAGKFSHTVSLFFVSEFLKTGKYQIQLFSADYHHHDIKMSDEGELFNSTEIYFSEKNYEHRFGKFVRINAEVETISGSDFVNFLQQYHSEQYGNVNLEPGYFVKRVMFSGQYLVARNSDGSMHVWNYVGDLKKSYQQQYQAHICTSSFSTQIPYEPKLDLERIFSLRQGMYSDSGKIALRPRNQQILSITYDKGDQFGHHKLAELQTKPQFSLFDIVNESSELLKINYIYGTVEDVAFTPDGQFLAMTYDKVILFWSLETQKFVKTLKGHDENITKLAFSRNHQYMISVDKDIMLLWKTKSKKVEDLQCVYVISKLREIKSIYWVENNFGLFFMTSHDDGVVRYWRIENHPLRCTLQWASDQQALMLNGMQVISTHGLDSKQFILLKQQGAQFENKNLPRERQLGINLLTNNPYDSKQAVKISKPFEKWRDWELDRAASIFIRRGHAKSNLLLHAEAIEEYNQALFAEPNNEDALLYRTYAKCDMGLYLEAIEDCTQILNINTKQESVLLACCLRGDMKRFLGRYKEAIADYEQILQVDPEYKYLHSKKSIAEACLGNFEVAMSDSACALKFEIDSPNSVILGRSAVVFAFSDKVKEAEQQLAVMKHNAYEAGFSEYFEGWIHLLLNDYQKAIGCFNDVERHQATMNDFYYMASHHALRGLAYFKMENIQLALVDLEKALNYIPEHIEWKVWYQACKKTSLQKSISTLIETYPYGYGKDQNSDIELKKALLPNLEEILKNCENADLDSEQLVLILTYLGDAYSVLGNAEQKKALLDRALPIAEKCYGENHPHVAVILTNLGNACGALGDKQKKKELLERALLIKETHYGKEHYEIASTLTNLGNAHGALGDMQKKKELLERALFIKEKHYGKEHYEVATTLTNLGNVYGALGDKQEKKELLERALLIRERHYGKAHYRVSLILANLGNVYGALGDMQKKKESFERALPIFEKHYGKEHQTYKEAESILNSISVSYKNDQASSHNQSFSLKTEDVIISPASPVSQPTQVRSDIRSKPDTDELNIIVFGTGQ